jgi:very-short-patch-repair endonuclease
MCRNHGLATRADLRALGVTDRMIHRRLADGLLATANPRVLALPGTPMNLETATRAAALALPGAIPTGPSAALLLGPGPWQGIDLGTRPWLIHRHTRLAGPLYVTHPDVRTVRAGGLLIAHPITAVVDLLRFWPEDDARAIGERALQLRLVTLADLAAAHANLSRHAGNAQLARIVSQLADGTRSEAERALCRLLRDAGLTGWQVNLRVSAGGRRYEIDVAFPRARLALEVDGRAFHSDGQSFQRDRRRQNDLVAAGWTVLRFTWSDLTERPHEVIARVVAALQQAVV